MGDHELPDPTRADAALDVAAVADRLRGEQEDVRARLASMTRDLEELFAASQGSNADDEHDPEGQTIAYERSQLSSLIAAANAHLLSIGEAQSRLREGRYGLCEVCGRPIPRARLEARPTARTCVAHGLTGGR